MHMLQMRYISSQATNSRMTGIFATKEGWAGDCQTPVQKNKSLVDAIVKPINHLLLNNK